MGTTILRLKTWEDNYRIGFNEYTFWGFIGHKKGFTDKWFSTIVPFSNEKAAWHFLGFRFTKTPSFVHKQYNEINGWYTNDKSLVNKLRNL
jgi:hypothetical protein